MPALFSTLEPRRAARKKETPITSNNEAIVSYDASSLLIRDVAAVDGSWIHIEPRFDGDRTVVRAILEVQTERTPAASCGPRPPCRGGLGAEGDEVWPTLRHDLVDDGLVQRPQLGRPLVQGVVPRCPLSFAVQLQHLVHLIDPALYRTVQDTGN